MDEKPSLQALERAGPGYPMRPGWIERQELESIRHGTVHRLVGLRCGPSVGRPMTGSIFERPCFGIGPGGGVCRHLPDYGPWTQSWGGRDPSVGSGVERPLYPAPGLVAQPGRVVAGGLPPRPLGEPAGSDRPHHEQRPGIQRILCSSLPMVLDVSGFATLGRTEAPFHWMQHFGYTPMKWGWRSWGRGFRACG